LKRKELATLALCSVVASFVIGSCAPRRSGGEAPDWEAARHYVETAADFATQRGRPVELIRQDGLPGESYPELTGDGAWSWFGDPRAVFYAGERRCTYVGWVNSFGDVVIGQYDHETGEFTSSVVAGAAG
jgi:hypothetical protein